MKAKDIKIKYKGSHMSLYEIDYKLPSGKIYTYEMVSKAGSSSSNIAELTLENIGKRIGAVSLIVFNKEHDKMLLAKEFRMGVNRDVISFIAGNIDDNESVIEAATRELKEETGLQLTKVLKQLNPTFTCAPVCDDIVTVIICEAEGKLTGSDSEKEDIKAIWVNKEAAEKMLEDDRYIFAGRAQAAVYGWVMANI